MVVMNLLLIENMLIGTLWEFVSVTFIYVWCNW